MVEPKKAPVKKTAAQRDSDVARAVKSLDASNVGVEKALTYVGDGLIGIQRGRRRERVVMLLIALMVVGLCWNAYEGRQARHKLVDQSQTQTETLRILKDATGPAAQAKAQKSLGEAFRQIDCNNQRAIARAMTQLGYDYQLTESCR